MKSILFHITNVFINNQNFTPTKKQRKKETAQQRNYQQLPATFIRVVFHLFSDLTYHSNLDIDTLAATLPGAWLYSVRLGLVGPVVSILCEVASLICDFISMWQHVQFSEQVRPWEALFMLLGR